MGIAWVCEIFGWNDDWLIDGANFRRGETPRGTSVREFHPINCAILPPYVHFSAIPRKTGYSDFIAWDYLCGYYAQPCHMSYALWHRTKKLLVTTVGLIVLWRIRSVDISRVSNCRRPSSRWNEFKVKHQSEEDKRHGTLSQHGESSVMNNINKITGVDIAREVYFWGT